MYIKIFKERPEEGDFSTRVAALILEAGGKVLFLRFGQEKGRVWTVPAGKVEDGEEIEEGLKREVFEEAGIVVGDVKKLSTFYVVKGDFSYVYHSFFVLVDEVPEVRLSREHVEYGWFDFGDAIESLDLIMGGKEVLEHDYKKAFSPA